MLWKWFQSRTFQHLLNTFISYYISQWNSHLLAYMAAHISHRNGHQCKCWNRWCFLNSQSHLYVCSAIQYTIITFTSNHIIFKITFCDSSPMILINQIKKKTTNNVISDYLGWLHTASIFFTVTYNKIQINKWIKINSILEKHIIPTSSPLLALDKTMEFSNSSHCKKKKERKRN